MDQGAFFILSIKALFTRSFSGHMFAHLIDDPYDFERLLAGHPAEHGLLAHVRALVQEEVAVTEQADRREVLDA